MKRHQSLLFRVLLAITGVMVCIALVVFFLIDSKLKQVVDQSLEHVYREKIEDIVGVLEVNNKKLKGTGNVTAYREGLQHLAVHALRSSLYRSSETLDYPMILNADGAVVMHPSLEKGDATFAKDLFARKALSLKQGSFIYHPDNKEKHWCVFSTYGPWNWLVLFTIPQEYKYRDLVHFKRNVSGILLLVCILGLSVLGILLFRVVKPITNLSKASKAIAEGDLQVELYSDRDDEVGELTRSFLLMQQAVKKQVEETEAHNKKLRDKIQQRKQATVALVESEKRYREIFNTPEDAIFLYNVEDGEIVDVNKGMLEMFCCSYEEALKLQLKGFVISKEPFTYKDAVEKINKALKEESQHFEWVSKKANGEIFWTEISLKKVIFDHTDYILAVVRDINDKKMATWALEDEQERLAVTLRSIGDGVISTDKNGNVSLLNHAGELLTGWKQEEAVGHHFSDVLNFVDTDGGESQELFSIEEVIDGNIVTLAKPTGLINRDRNVYTVSLSCTPIIGRDKNVWGAVVVIRDISNILKMEVEALKAKKLESIGILAGGLAHDFNNIIFGIQGNVNLAISSLDKDNVALRYLEAADKATIRAADLTQQLLTFSKGGEPVKRKILLNTLPEEAARVVISNSNNELSYSSDSDLLPVEVDSNQISQVIQNIVLNGVQAMDEAGVVTIHSRNYIQEDADTPGVIPVGKYVHISIRDQGKGISPDLQDKIFDPYFTTRKEGQGLGLSICHSVINNHNGYITVDSKPGEGTVFHLYLPAVEGDVQVAGTRTVADLQEKITESKIMIMDDEAIIRDLVTRILITEGYSVVAASDGEEAVRMYREMFEASAPPDVVITDLTVPGGMGGKYAAAEILKINPAAKLIVSSGYSNDPVLAHYSDYGFSEVLPKPYRRKELCRCVAQLL